MGTRVLIVNFKELNKLPPVINLIEVMVRNGMNVSVITFDEANIRERFPTVKFHILSKCSNNLVVNYFKRKVVLRRTTEKLMHEHEILWTTTDMTVRELGDMVYKYKHVMQLMELIEDFPLFPRQKIFKAPLDKYARKAYRVVVPEYNRAHILKAWWNLSVVPTVLPNKPASIMSEFEENEIMKQLRELKNEGKTLILYQGVITPERPIEVFARAVDRAKDDFVYLIMGNDKNGTVAEMKVKYNNVIHIPFISPPNHLQITSFADIGIAAYIPDRKTYSCRELYSILNPIYCAPNKIYEYAGYGIPMIGNDIPGLRILFEKYGMGEICDIEDSADIYEKINKIRLNKMSYIKGCHDFYNDADLDQIVTSILS